MSRVWLPLLLFVATDAHAAYAADAIAGFWRTEQGAAVIEIRPHRETGRRVTDPRG